MYSFSQVFRYFNKKKPMIEHKLDYALKPKYGKMYPSICFYPDPAVFRK